MKITQSNENITPFGGFNFCHELFNQTSLPQLIDQQLGQRVTSFGFSYSEILTNHMAIFLNGGDCTEDINVHLRENLKQIRGMAVCSADTILRGIKELATPSTDYLSDNGIIHQFNINPKLNTLLVKSVGVLAHQFLNR